MLSLSSVSSTAFTGLAAPRAPRADVRMASIEDLPGAGPETQGKVFDPLGLAKTVPYGSSQFEWMRTAELKHGRVCMAASVGWLISEAGIHFPGYLSKSADLTFAAVPAGVAGWAAVPMAGKMQILAACGAIEAYTEIQKPHYLNAGMPTAGSGSTKTERRKLSELKNGRLAMIAVAGFYAQSVLPGSVPMLPAGW